MLLKRAYVPSMDRKKDAFNNDPILRPFIENYEMHLHFGWRIGLTGFYQIINPEEEYQRWCVIHIPSGMRIGRCKYRWQAKLVAELFQLYGVSERTTQEEIQADPLWEQMRKVANEIRDFCR